jgi:hypothetical protein
MTHAAQQVVDAMTQWYTHLWHATYLEALLRVIHVIEVIATTVKTASIFYNRCVQCKGGSATVAVTHAVH